MRTTAMLGVAAVSAMIAASPAQAQANPPCSERYTLDWKVAQCEVWNLLAPALDQPSWAYCKGQYNEDPCDDNACSFKRNLVTCDSVQIGQNWRRTLSKISITDAALGASIVGDVSAALALAESLTASYAEINFVKVEIENQASLDLTTCFTPICSALAQGCSFSGSQCTGSCTVNGICAGSAAPSKSPTTPAPTPQPTAPTTVSPTRSPVTSKPTLSPSTTPPTPEPTTKAPTMKPSFAPTKNGETRSPSQSPTQTDATPSPTEATPAPTDPRVETGAPTPSGAVAAEASALLLVALGTLLAFL